MKWNTVYLITSCALVGLLALTLSGCPEPTAPEAEVITGTVEELPQAAEETLTNEPEQPGTEQIPAGVEVEEMTDETPPHVEEQGEAGAPAPAPEPPDAPPAPAPE